MERRQPYGLTKPCKLCPFRTDIPPYLTAPRVREIERSLDRSEFPCHETVDYDDEGERSGEGPREMHCAGALILMMHEGTSSQMHRISHRLGLYDPSKLDMTAPVFTSWDEMADAQPRPRSPRRRRACR